MIIMEGLGMMNMYEKMGVLVIDDGGVNFIVVKLVGGGMVVNWCVFFKMLEYVCNEWVNDYGFDLFSSDWYDCVM